MKKAHIQYLVCPDCIAPLALVEAEYSTSERVISGVLRCKICNQDYPVVNSIPRFGPESNYAENFGFEWLKHARTQYDEYSGRRDSSLRFESETPWPSDLKGEMILEVGSGSGRFTAKAAQTGAMVISMDYSRAVEANYASNGHCDNVLIIQANLYKMPFPKASFDRLFCLGVLQHTPSVHEAFISLSPYLKPGKHIAIDCYCKRPGVLPWLLRAISAKYFVRHFIRLMNPEKLYCWCERHTRRLWPLAQCINKIPMIGPTINRRLLVVYYGDDYRDLSEEMLKEWGVLDLFDQLSPMYDSPQYLATIRKWFDEVGLEKTDVQYGYNGINGRGVKPYGELRTLCDNRLV
ncbi:MAG: hypothetical protein A2X46_05160 [Lentisphaerae bacterium GWF2_57_35]|nr:MAG: hypothetical protein A2X46_05160 [Lentisphaerae bacterium GWF2_57_35]